MDKVLPGSEKVVVNPPKFGALKLYIFTVQVESDGIDSITSMLLNCFKRAEEMSRNALSPSAESAIALCFNKNSMPTQQETLGLIVGEILKENVQLSRMTICTKLLHRIDGASCEEEVAHYNGLIALFFER